MGYNAIERKEITGADGKPLIPERDNDLSMLSLEDRAKLLEIARKVERTE